MSYVGKGEAQHWYRICTDAWSRLCAGCNHPEWCHRGIKEPGCGWLGACGCERFVPPEEES